MLAVVAAVVAARAKATAAAGTPTTEQAAEALRAAAAEGLDLERSNNEAGFANVQADGRRFRAGHNGRLGTFDTAEQVTR